MIVLVIEICAMSDFRFYSSPVLGLCTHAHFRISPLHQGTICCWVVTFQPCLRFQSHRKAGRGDIRWRMIQHVFWWIRPQVVWRWWQTRSAWQKFSWSCPTSFSDLDTPTLSRPRPLSWDARLCPSGDTILMQNRFRLRWRCCLFITYKRGFPLFESELPFESVPRIRYHLYERSSPSSYFWISELLCLRHRRRLSKRHLVRTCASGRQPVH